MGYAIKTLNASLRSRSCKHSLMVKLALSWIRDPVTSCKPLCPACADDLRSAGGHSQQPINADYHSAEAKEKKRDPREAPVLKPNEQKRSTCKMNCVCVNLVLISSILLFVAQPCCCLSAARAEQRALPRVACSGRRMRAVFGPMVKANIHVQGTYEAGKGFSFLSIAFVLYCVCAVCLSFQISQGPESQCRCGRALVEWDWAERRTRASHSSADMTAAMHTEKYRPIYLMMPIIF